MLILSWFTAYLANSWQTLLFALINTLLLICYEQWLKALPLLGNIVIASLVASSFAFGAIAINLPSNGAGKVWQVMILALLMNTARELLKDRTDKFADKHSRLTLPMLIEDKKTTYLVNTLISLSILLSFWWGKAWCAPAQGLLIIADILFVSSLFYSHKAPEMASKRLKIAMLPALIAFTWSTTP